MLRQAQHERGGKISRSFRARDFSRVEKCPFIYSVKKNG